MSAMVGFARLLSVVRCRYGGRGRIQLHSLCPQHCLPPMLSFIHRKQQQAGLLVSRCIMNTFGARSSHRVVAPVPVTRKFDHFCISASVQTGRVLSAWGSLATNTSRNLARFQQQTHYTALAAVGKTTAPTNGSSSDDTSPHDLMVDSGEFDVFSGAMPKAEIGALRFLQARWRS